MQGSLPCHEDRQPALTCLHVLHILASQHLLGWQACPDWGTASMADDAWTQQHDQVCSVVTPAQAAAWKLTL